MNHFLLNLAQEIDLSPLPGANATQGNVQTIINIVFSITGAISLLIITIAGFQYIVSQGDPQAVGKAKNAIIYACVGLGISILAVSIVTFVFKAVG